MKPLTIAELRRQCSKLQLPISGKKSDLLARLRNHRVSSETPVSKASSSSETTRSLDSIDCLISVSVPFDVQDIIDMARQHLERAARDDPLHEESLSDGTVVVTNVRGRFWTRMERIYASTRADLASTRADLASTRADLASTRADLASLRQKLESETTKLWAKTDELERASVELRAFRHRFISTYKRGVLKQVDPSDRQYIKKGNDIVHGGNLKRDAELYTGLNARHDFLVFQSLYGVLPRTALAIKHIDTMIVLEKHATIIADPSYIITPTFHDRFSEFIAARDQQRYPNYYLETEEEPAKQY